jgi:uncharacterized protein YraI
MKFRYLIMTFALLLLLIPMGVSLAQGGGDNPIVTVIPDFLYIRQTPSTNGTALGSLPRGSELTTLGVERNANDSGTWVFVESSDGQLQGWVRADFLNYPSDFVGLSKLPVVNSQGTVGGVVAPVSSNAPNAPSSNMATVNTANGLAATTNEFANLRTGPELTFSVIEQLLPGAEIVLVGRNANGVWLQAVAGDQVGWVFFQLVEVEGDVNSLPVVGAGQTVVAVTTNPGTTTTTDSAPAPVSSGRGPTNLGLVPGTPAEASDGRINATDSLGNLLVYCVNGNGHTNAGNFDNGGGILVYDWVARTPRFFVGEGQIKVARANRPADGVIATDGVFVLYVLDATRFSLTGVINNAPFELQWPNCEAGGLKK